MNQTKARFDWVDYLKGFCMIAVFMTHLSWPEWYARFLSPFQLAGFFFVGGYTYNLKSSFREFLTVKLRTLFIPVLVFGFINAFLTYIYPGAVLKERLLGVILQIPGRWDDLWFVACLFTMELIFYPILRFISSNVGRTGIVLLLSVCGVLYAISGRPHLPWQLENACVMLPFLFLGYLSRREAHVASLFGKLRNVSVFIGMSLLYVILICGYDNYPIDIHVLQYGSIAYFMLSALMGTLLMVSLSMVLENWAGCRLMKMLQYVGKNTLVYYAFQSKVITIIVTFFSFYGIRSSTYISNLLFALLVCLILVVPAEIINRFFPFIIGRPYSGSRKV